VELTLCQEINHTTRISRTRDPTITLASRIRQAIIWLMHLSSQTISGVITRMIRILILIHLRKDLRLMTKSWTRTVWWMIRTTRVIIQVTWITTSQATEAISFALHATEDILILKSMQRTNAKPATRKPRSTRRILRTTMQSTKQCSK
jgi:hypothetical protein